MSTLAPGTPPGHPPHRYPAGTPFLGGSPGHPCLSSPCLGTQPLEPPLLCIAFSAWGQKGSQPRHPPALRRGDNWSPWPPAATVPQARALHVSVSASKQLHGSALIHDSSVGVLAPHSAPRLFPLLTSLQETVQRLLLLERKGFGAQSPLLAASPSPSNGCRKTPPSPAPGVGLSLTPVAPAPGGTVTLSTSSEHRSPVHNPTTEASHPRGLKPRCNSPCRKAGSKLETASILQHPPAPPCTPPASSFVYKLGSNRGGHGDVVPKQVAVVPPPGGSQRDELAASPCCPLLGTRTVPTCKGTAAPPGDYLTSEVPVLALARCPGLVSSVRPSPCSSRHPGAYAEPHGQDFQAPAFSTSRRIPLISMGLTQSRCQARFAGNDGKR
ncbi:uncharacterized protein LOC142417839 [Mycteria americana]|uniref:uncharacterized protein LOC142417839 n=1 Tax=Mycteria americana TaxID=33587 RepID=UPI003F58712D